MVRWNTVHLITVYKETKREGHYRTIHLQARPPSITSPWPTPVLSLSHCISPLLVPSTFPILYSVAPFFFSILFPLHIYTCHLTPLTVFALSCVCLCLCPCTCRLLYIYLSVSFCIALCLPPMNSIPPSLPPLSSSPSLSFTQNASCPFHPISIINYRTASIITARVNIHRRGMLPFPFLSL